MSISIIELAGVAFPRPLVLSKQRRQREEPELHDGEEEEEEEEAKELPVIVRLSVREEVVVFGEQQLRGMIMVPVVDQVDGGEVAAVDAPSPLLPLQPVFRAANVRLIHNEKEEVGDVALTAALRCIFCLQILIF
jgi:hypothetical protein